jgi:hypothetical protein
MLTVASEAVRVGAEEFQACPAPASGAKVTGAPSCPRR